MRRPLVLAVLLVLFGLILAACSSPSGSGEPGASAGGEPPAQSEEPGQSQGGGNGGDGEAPVLADGQWTGGEGEVNVTGAVSGSFSGAITPPSGTYSGATTLLYVLGDSGTLTIGINAEEAFGAAVTTADFVTGGGSAQGCEVDYQQADDSRIEGTFRCENADAIGTGGLDVGTVTFEGSFTATR